MSSFIENISALSWKQNYVSSCVEDHKLSVVICCIFEKMLMITDQKPFLTLTVSRGN